MSNLQASNLFSVQGRVAVITGGGSGLGRTMARALAINGASKIFVLGRREDALRDTAALAQDGLIIPIKCDITSKESLEAAYQAVAAQTTHVDVLFANGGILGPLMRPPPPKADGSLPSLAEVREELFNIPMAEFTKVMDVNVTGSYYTVLAFLPLLEAANQRRPAPQIGVLSPPTAQVVITSSIAGFNRKVPFSYAYNVSKAAVTHLIKSLSTNLSPYDIRVNGIAPGLYHSEMAENLFADGGIQGSGISDGSFPREMIPLTRGGSSEDIAGLILWMVSTSGGYLNGTMMLTDGGRIGSVPNTY
ncbi:Short-chain dehydrogenase/reductase SAT3 [Penicillium canariense]|uniref:Short-chain dehydrogenase/reductase SAT3 n=1 Tax=Penicillium canariense TaxID=189055 RepID=A0A9W9HYC0_9EURO|nr:Short-chain dehydrogenase/reductase SAT3 [Penicillium canariense]KAJ5160063.1 Short-chain dehydrogenase/reductase SAT3 [Penicillium canariense]